MSVNPKAPAPFNDPDYLIAIQELGSVIANNQTLVGAVGLDQNQLIGNLQVGARKNWNLFLQERANFVAVIQGKATATLDANGVPIVTMK